MVRDEGGGTPTSRDDSLVVVLGEVEGGGRWKATNDDTLSDAYTVQRTHTKTKTKPSYVPATFCDQKQMSAEGSDA